MSQLLNYVLLLVLIVVQWRLSRALRDTVERRAPKRARGIALGVVYGFNIVVVACYLCGFARLTARLGISRPLVTILGAAALAYVIAAAAVLCIYVVVQALRKHLDADADPARRRALNVAGTLAMASPFAIIAYGALVQRTDFRVREIDVPLPGLPDDLNGLRILQLSDIHLSPFLSVSELERVIDACLELHPNLAVVTGDLISTASDPLDACIRQLARVKADAGIFGCMGNHERYIGAERYAARAAAAVGIRFLRGRAHKLRFGKAVLNLAGVDYQPLAGKDAYLWGAHSMIAPGTCNILLSHNPDVFPVAAKQGWNFMLSGHTHGGQVTVEILDQSINPARFMTPYVYGLYNLGGSAAYVTRGIGTIGIPARIGAPPEISLLRLRKA